MQLSDERIHGENKPNRPRIFRLSISAEKGRKKHNVKKVKIVASRGITGDAHAGSLRAVSLLPYESFSKFADRKLNINPGDFAENITTIGIDLERATVGTKIALGDSVILEIVQIGKECHNDCNIRQTLGNCIMPREGIFARVLVGGELKEGDPISILE